MRFLRMYVVLIVLLSTSLYSYAGDIGNYRISERVKYAGTVIEPGTYTIQIIDGEDGAYVQLSKSGQIVQKDLAIVIQGRGTVSKPQVQIARIANQEFLRIRIRSGENWYYAYMERMR